MAAGSTHEIVPPVVALSGADQYIKRHHLRQLLHTAFGGEPDITACSEFESNVELAEVLDELRTFPMLSPRRVVIVCDADPFVTKYREGLERYCDEPCDTATLVLLLKTFPANTRLHKAVARIGRVHKCDPPKGMALANWISEHARREYDKTVDRAAAALLRDLVGDDLQAIDAELSKLAVYAGDAQQIRAEDVEQLVGLRRQEKVFGIADALAQRDVRKALHLWDQVWATDRAAPGRAIGGLAWAMRRYLSAKYQVEGGGSPAALARQFYTTPAELETRLSRIDLETLEESLCALLDADIGIKTGQHDARAAVEKFIVEHCTAKAV
jgi:DNA polymerase-3 subunit delta